MNGLKNKTLKEDRLFPENSNRTLIVFIIVISIMMAFYQMSSIILPTFSPVEHQAIHLGFALLLIFLWDMLTTRNKIKQGIDFVFLSLSIIAIGYILFNFEELVNTVGQITNAKVIIGALLVVLIIEGTRKTFGIALPILVVVALFYARYGDIFPGFLFHSGMDWDRLLPSLSTNLTGTFGTILNVSATFIILFMIFGGLLESSGAGQFFINMAMAIGGRFKSGAAQAAIISSGSIGSINGSAVANVASTGMFTIPLMKKTGYSPRLAGAMEGVASTGGMIMPPIMGVAAFIMAGMTGIPYTEIIIAALVPAILYYFSLCVSVHLHAVKHDFKPIDDKEIPSFKKTFKEGVHFLIPLVAIVYFLFDGLSIARAGFNGIITLIVVVVVINSIKNPKYLLSRDFRTFIVEGLIKGIKNGIGVAAACASMGIVSHVFVTTGLALQMVYIIQDFSGGVGFVALLLTMVISLLFGMGVPTTASYIMVAVIGAQAIIELGFPTIAIHLFILYYAILANITPPVSAAILVASKISGSNYIRTGMTAMRLGLPGFILPFLFVYHEELLLQGAPLDIVIVILTAMLGLICLSVTFEGYFFKSIGILERLFFLGLSITLVYPEFISDVLGFIALLTVFLFNISRKAKTLEIHSFR